MGQCPSRGLGQNRRPIGVDIPTGAGTRGGRSTGVAVEPAPSQPRPSGNGTTSAGGAPLGRGRGESVGPQPANLRCRSQSARPVALAGYYRVGRNSLGAYDFAGSVARTSSLQAVIVECLNGLPGPVAPIDTCRFRAGGHVADLVALGSRSEMIGYPTVVHASM